MRVHFIQHVPFEGPGCISAFLQPKHQLSYTHLYRGQPLPSPGQIDCLIIMGGPMSIFDEQKYPWLKEEKRFIAEVIESDKVALGICLGAQLIAHVLGAKIEKNKYREIGWFPIYRNSEIENTLLNDVFPGELEVFHWHGDTFELPENSVLIASSEACKNQGFILENRIIGLQFHLEATPETAKALISHGRRELDNSRYVQSEREILSSEAKFDAINKVMFRLLQRIEERRS
ncbi:MAG: type 1 glutamine amidotransferase [Calditrichaeota bacterium]|nr:type 1 glutamine amidotransferase [Calditrichota bacterium]